MPDDESSYDGVGSKGLKVRILHVKRELPFLRVPVSFFLKGIYRGNVYSLSASSEVG